MIAYNQTGLDNLDIQDQADKALAAGCLSSEERRRIGASYPIVFYTPNIWICLGLFLLTLVIAFSSLGLFVQFISGGSQAMAPLLFIFGLICYGGLEYVVNKLQHFRSGVDSALLWMSAGLLYASICLAVDHVSSIFQSFLLFILGLFYVFRYANYVMSLVAYSALLALMINMAAELSKIVQLLTPFFIMVVSVTSWFLFARLYSLETCRHYRLCLKTLKGAALLSFYLAGNYFIVREMGPYMFGPAQQLPGGGITMGGFFWILTVNIPLCYIILGIRKRDRIFLWVGLAMMALAVCTIRHYYRVLPLEWAMIWGGMGLMALAYVLIRYLNTPRHGFSARESYDQHVWESPVIESIVMAETFKGQGDTPATQEFTFGGGSGGGGGAGGDF